MASYYTEDDRTITRALVWLFTGLALLLTAGRYLIRVRIQQGLQWDDLAHGFAAVMLVGWAATWTVYVDVFVAVWSDTERDPEAFNTYTKALLAVVCLLWVIIYSVKLAFLLFYRDIFGVNETFRKWWWAVSGLTGLFFLMSFMTAFWSCAVPASVNAIGACLSPTSFAIVDQVVIIASVLNIVSDLAIMALPLFMLRRLSISSWHKAGLIIIFTLTTIDIVLDILRILGNLGTPIQALDVIFSIEPAVAVIVSTLPTFRALLPAAGKRSDQPSKSSWRRLFSTTSQRTPISISAPTSMSQGTRRPSDQSKSLYDSSQHLDQRFEERIIV